MSLRARLLVLLLVLLGAGLVVSGFATTALLRTYLLRRIDAQLRDSGVAAQQRFGGDHGPGGPEGGGGRGAPPANRISDTDIRAARIDTGGAVVSEITSGFTSGTSPFTSLPSSVL